MWWEVALDFLRPVLETGIGAFVGFLFALKLDSLRQRQMQIDDQTDAVEAVLEELRLIQGQIVSGGRTPPLSYIPDTALRTRIIDIPKWIRNEPRYAHVLARQYVDIRQRQLSNSPGTATATSLADLSDQLRTAVEGAITALERYPKAVPA